MSLAILLNNKLLFEISIWSPSYSTTMKMDMCLPCKSLYTKMQLCTSMSQNHYN